MNFLNPFVLFGLAAASIPIILHLINLRKQKTIEFSSLKFLKELQKSSIKKLKIKQWLLLLLRTLLIIFAVLAFSRPTIESNLPGFTEYSNTSLILLIDNSYSMDVSDEDGNRLRQSKTVATSLINTMKEGDQAIIIPMSNTAPLRSFSWSTNKDLLVEKVNEIAIGTGIADVNTNLKYSSILMNEATNLNKLVYLISDLQSNILTNLDTTDYYQKDISLLVAHIGKDSKKVFNNLSIDSARIVSTIIQKDKPVEIELFIKNHSDRKVSDNMVSLFYNDKKVAQKTIDISGDETKSIAITAPYNSSGIVKTKLQLESDELEIDNSYYFVFNIPKQPFVTVLSERNNLFLDAILSNMKEINAISDFNYIDNISGFNAGKEKVLIVAKSQLQKSDIARINQLQSDNAKIIMFAPTENINEFVANSNQLGINIKGVSRYDLQAGEFTKVDKLHPIFSGVFIGETASQKEVESPQLKVELPTTNGRAIIESATGNFLSEHTVGNSTILYYSVAPNTEWSNFPVVSIFPSLLYKSITYLNAGFENNINSHTEQNTLIVDSELSGSSKFEIINPNNESMFTEANKTANNYIIQIDDKSKFGNYLVKNNNQEIVAYYSINAEKSESELQSVNESELIEKLDKLGIESDNISILEDKNKIEESIQRAKLGTELWQLFLVLALICGIIELLVEKSSNKIENEN